VGVTPARCLFVIEDAPDGIQAAPRWWNEGAWRPRAFAIPDALASKREMSPTPSST